MVRATGTAGCASCGSVAGHLAHEVPGAWLSATMAVATQRLLHRGGVRLLVWACAAVVWTCSDIEAGQVEALQQAGLARVGHPQHSQTMLERGGAAIAFGEVA